MQQPSTTPNIAIFADFENVALGVRDAHYDPFDVGLVVARLLDKGKVIVRKAYCDWERYKTAKKPMHEAGFELIEVPHVSYSGKNSADIRMVVDALDMCHTKAHIDVFVLVTGDSDFSPLVAKLRENDKTVIGMGVKNSTSDLLVQACDEFIYYDELVQGRRKESHKVPERTNEKTGEATADKPKEPEHPKSKAPRSPRETPEAKAARLAADEEALAARRAQGLEIVLDTVEAMFREHDDQVWGSTVKQTVKRKHPTFTESSCGYKTFSQLLEDARDKGFLEIKKDEKSGGYLILSFGPEG